MQVTLHITPKLYDKIKRTKKPFNEFFVDLAEEYFSHAEEAVKAEVPAEVILEVVEKKVAREVPSEAEKDKPRGMKKVGYSKKK